MNPVNSQPTFSERMRNAKGIGFQEPRSCDRCGGTYFIVHQVTEVAKGGYGSVQMRPLTVVPYQLAQCLCGEFITSDSLVKGRAEDDRFVLSVKKAREIKLKGNPDHMASVTADYVGREVWPLKAEVEKLVRRVDTLESPPPAAVTAAPAPVVIEATATGSREEAEQATQTELEAERPIQPVLEVRSGKKKH